LSAFGSNGIKFSTKHHCFFFTLSDFMRTFLIAGNWKMHTTPAEATTLATAVAKGSAAQTTASHANAVHVLMCVPFTSIHAASEAVREPAPASAVSVSIGAQNCHHESKGAFTGEIAASMLKAAGCSHVILGHSERRQYAGETDALLNHKLKAALQAGLVPVYCVGETLEERQTNKTFDVIREQMAAALANITLNTASELVVAYEPVWAIGTGLAATSEQAQEVHAFIRGLLEARYGGLAKDIAILYGGSMKPENAHELLSKLDVNGGLIGGAALQAESFLSIIASAVAVSQAS
jgi:triosephosphate isomerase (TIM)